MDQPKRTIQITIQKIATIGTTQTKCPKYRGQPDAIYAILFEIQQAQDYKIQEQVDDDKNRFFQAWVTRQAKVPKKESDNPIMEYKQ